MTKLIFLHIPKTAGATIAFTMQRQYKGQRVYATYGQTKMRDFLALSQAERDSYACVMGHMRFGLHRYFSGSTTYFTLLRNPVEQIISSYHYVQNYPHHPHHQAFKGMSIEEFVASTRAGEAQTKILYGFDDPQNIIPLREPLPTDGLEVAKRNLTTHFNVVGLVEEFDLTLLLLRHVFGWHDIRYVQRNINKLRPRTESPEMLRYIEEAAQPDIALYQFACGLFEQQVAQFSPQIYDELDRFRKLNNLYGKYAEITNRLRHNRLYRKMRAMLAQHSEQS